MINLHKPLQLLQYFWQLWNLRGFILFSFSLQCMLIIGSSLRIQTARPWVHKVIWLVYLLADWAAYYAIGLVVPINRLKDKDTYDIRSFWAPFLLLHIGGPNTIAGFSLEDNELWDRSVLHILVQGGATIIAIVRSLSRKRLLAPTLLVFVAAFTRYIGRILALYEGSMDSLRETIAQRRSRKEAQPTMPGPRRNYYFESSIKPVEMVTNSYELFQKFKGMFCGLSIRADGEVLSYREKLYTLEPKQAFIEMETELGLAYGLFYTKIWTITEDRAGRILHGVSLASEVAALFLWVMADKHGYEKVDVRLTNALLFGGVFLDLVSMLKLVFSDLVIYRLLKLCRDSHLVASALNMVLKAKNETWAKRFVLFRRWSGSVKQFNLVEYKDYQRRCCGSRWLRKWWDKAFGREEGVSRVRLSDEVKEHILRCIKLRALHWQRPWSEDEMLEKQPSRVLAEYVQEGYDDKELFSNAIQQICKGLGVVDALIIWHTTTHLFYTYKMKVRLEEDLDDETTTRIRKCNNQLSKYLMYLLFHQQNMILEGVQLDKTMEDMAQHLKKIKEEVSKNPKFQSLKSDESATEQDEQDALDQQKKHIEERLKRQGKNDEEGSVHLISELASYIVNKLEPTEQSEEIMSEIWIDLLLYAAGRCRGRTHVQQLGNGGELLTVVWLMATHLDLTIKLPA